MPQRSSALAAGTLVAGAVAMSSTPSTRLNVDQSLLRDRIRRLAALESTDAPILSVYLDLRPETTGESPARRAALTVLRDRLRQIEGTLPARGAAADSFRADIKRITDLLESNEVRSLDGVAIHACDAEGAWEVTHAGVPFATQISAAPIADLYQLARLLDEQETSVIALIDTSTCRLFVTRRGGLFERGGPDEDPVEHTRHDQGGWSQARFQRHIDEQDKRFAKEAADAIAQLVTREAAQRIVLAGEERAITALDEQLPKQVRDLVAHVERIDIRAERDEIAEEVRPLLAAIEEAEGETVANRALAGIRSDGLGVGGVEPVMQALEMGQVLELVVDETAGLDEELRAELVRQAALTDARVESVDGHPGLERFDGVVATLRYRL
jgi:peptide chain release factor subunit 1